MRKNSTTKGRSADLNILPASTTHTHGQTIFVNGIPADNDINSYNFLQGRSVDLNLLHLSITHTLGQTILSTASLLTMTSTAVTSYREGLLTWTSCNFLQHTHMVRLLYQQHVCWLEHLVYQYNACMWSDLLQWQQISQRSTTDNHSSSSQVATVSFLLVAF